MFSSAGANASTFALFATLRGSPFSDVNYTVNLQIFPKNKSNKFNPSLCHSPQNIYITDGVHVPITAIVPGGKPPNGGRKTKLNFKP